MVQDLYVQVNNLSTTEVWGFSQKNMPNVVGVIKCPLNNGNFDNPKSYSVHLEFVIYVLQTGIQSVWIWRSNWATALETRVCLGHHRVFFPFMPELGAGACLTCGQCFDLKIYRLAVWQSTEPSQLMKWTYSGDSLKITNCNWCHMNVMNSHRTKSQIDAWSGK